MKLRILNDLHIEFEDFAPPATDADVVILARDIGAGMGGLQPSGVCAGGTESGFQAGFCY